MAAGVVVVVLMAICSAALIQAARELMLMFIRALAAAVRVSVAMAQAVAQHHPLTRAQAAGAAGKVLQPVKAAPVRPAAPQRLQRQAQRIRVCPLYVSPVMFTRQAVAAA